MKGNGPAGGDSGRDRDYGMRPRNPFRLLLPVTVTVPAVKKPAETRCPATLRQIAAAAGVSSMTVSRALGHRREIAAATRDRIREIARRLGYRPDPEVAKLMHHLRGRRRQRFQSIICGLTTRVNSDHENYFNALAAGAEAQARSRGYGLMVQRIDPAPARWSGVDRMLRSRGVEGLLLLPQRLPIDLGRLLDWSAYSAVSTSHSATGPAVHRVTPHHFANTLLLCRTLAAQGCKRIGMVISAQHDVRSEHGFTAAATWHGLREAPRAVPPLVHTETLAEPLRAWFAREKPDAIIANELDAARDYARVLQLKLGGPVRFAVTSLPPNDTSPIGGIDERPAAIGAAAIDLLAGLIERRIRGTPDLATSTLLEGIWRA
jgi:LacI family transcriptional regulator